MKALIPAAGLGTRFLPATKAVPKEMLLVVDRPVIQYVVEEGLVPLLTKLSSSTAARKRQSKSTSRPTPPWWSTCAAWVKMHTLMRWSMRAILT